MAEPKRFWLTVLISVILAVLVGYWLRGLLDMPEQVTQRLVVGPTAKDIRGDDLILHITSMDQVVWTAQDGATPLSIEFEQDIFDGTTPVNGRYQVRCSGAQCSSGNIKKGTKTGQSYKYWQRLGAGTPVDGRIIIMR